MQSFYKIDMLDISLNMLEFVGETKNVASRKLITFRIFNYTVLILILFDVFINFNYVNGEYYVKTLQSVFYLSQVSCALHFQTYKQIGNCRCFLSVIIKIRAPNYTKANSSIYFKQHVNKVLELSQFR